MGSVVIRPATASDIEAFYGQRPMKSVKAVAILQDDVLAAVAGFTLEAGGLVAFSDVRDDVTAPPLTVWRVAKEAMAFITKSNAPVIAMASQKFPNSGKFLERLGFRHIGPSEHGEVYQWQS